MASEWKTELLGNLCLMKNGYAFKSKDFVSQGIPVIKIKNVKPNRILVDDLSYVPVDVAEQRKKWLIEKGEILLTMTGNRADGSPESWVGKAAIFNENTPYLLNQRVSALKAKDENIIDTNYLGYYLSSWQTQLYFIKRANSSGGQANISPEIVMNMPIHYPPLTTQKKIVSILAALDQKIKINAAINDNLQQQAFTLFENMFKGMFSSDTGRVGDHIVPKRGKSLLSKNAIAGDVPVVAGGLEASTYHNTANTVPPVITISASGANAGFVNLWSIPVWSSDSTFIDATMTDAVYFWFVLLKKRQQEIYDAQTGSAQPHIYPQHIANLPLGELTNSKISEYQTMVSPFFATIGSNIEENARLAAIRDALLPRLMSGEIDVSAIDD